MAWQVLTYVAAAEDDRAALEGVFARFFPEGYETLDPEAILAHIRASHWDAHEFDPAMLAASALAYRGYWPRERAVQPLEAALREAGLAGTLQSEPMPEIDWQAAVEAAQQPIDLAPGIQVVPSHAVPRGKPEVVLRLTPGLGFGSGSHETTRLAATALIRTLRPGMRVFDLGTGSGLLAILAMRLGAGEVWATDNDPQAVRAARANARANETELTVLEGSLCEGLSGQADLIVANIITDVLLQLAGQVAPYLAPGGRLLCSGIHPERLPELEAALIASGLQVLERQRGKEWAALIAAVDHE